MVFFLETKFRVLVVAMIVLAVTNACKTETPEEDFAEIVATFPFQSLALTPIAATAAGYHEHIEGADEEGLGGTKIALDELLDDYSPAGVQKRVSFYKDFRKRLHDAVQREKLAGDFWADYAVIDNHIARELVELERIRSHEHDPNLYVRLLGTALYTPLVHEYASKTERYGHIIARLDKIPGFIDQAKQNLQSSPPVWTEVAQQGNTGLISLIENVIPASLPAELRADHDRASEAALSALAGFGDYLANDLAGRNNHDWRLGPELYEAKFKAMLATDQSPDEVLAQAEQEFQVVIAETIEVAEDLDKEIYGSARPPSNKRRLINGVLEVVQEENKLRRPTDLIDEIKKGLDELRTSIKEANMLPDLRRDNLQVVNTPEFMRGLYPVAGFLGAPALEPKLGAFYWVTPVPADWSRKRLQSWLREYNRHALKLLSLHEAMPGHYAQVELTNKIEKPYRRVLRAVFGNSAYVEGWATYVTEAMMTAGLEQNNNAFKMVWQKIALRVLANTIVDIRMHTKNMSDEEALNFLRTEAYQEAEEADAKLRCAKLTSAQLPAYYVGWKGWSKVRDHYQTETQDFILSSFHDKALRAGPLPVKELGYIVAQRPMAD